MKVFNRIFWCMFSLMCVTGIATATSWTKTDIITSSSGAAVDFPAGLTIAEQSFTPNGIMLSGASSAAVYTVGTNVIAASNSALNFVQVGNNIHAFGETAVTTTAAGGITSTLQIPLPVARGGNFAATNGASGRCGANATNPASSGGVIVASTGGVLVNCVFGSTATSTTKINYSFDYVLTP